MQLHLKMITIIRNRNNIEKGANTLLEIIVNYDRRYSLEFDCNQETTLVRGAIQLKDFKNSI